MFDAVSLNRCDSYDEAAVAVALDKAIEDIGGLYFVKSGMKVGIKANLVTGDAPDKAVTTHPVLLKRLCERLVSLGAEVVIGDSPGGLYTPSFVKGIYKNCGLLELEAEFDGKVKLNDNFEVSDGVFEEGKSLTRFVYTSWLRDVDVIINFSKLKTHAMMGMSCAVKNMFGTIPGTTKPEYHMRFPNEVAFANVMVDLNEFFKPALYLVDAIDGMEGNGPTAGEKRHIGCILASRKPYALDMVCANIIGMELKDVQTLQAACDRKLGPSAISEVEIVGDVSLDEIRVPDFKRATIHQSITFEGGNLINLIKSAGVKLIYNTKPQVKVNECIGCKKCYETCPAKAITMVGAKGKSAGKLDMIPQIDRSKCIKCFCCQEFCPKGAMKVHYNILGRAVNKMQRGQ